LGKIGEPVSDQTANVRGSSAGLGTVAVEKCVDEKRSLARIDGLRHGGEASPQVGCPRKDGWRRVRGVRVALCHGNGLDGQRSLWDGDASAWSWW
jgi:hypothetical protein